MRATSVNRAWGWMNRPNNVPHYQRLHQQHDGVRQWSKARGKFMMPAFYALFYGTSAGTAWMMGRLVLGHKTWW